MGCRPRGCKEVNVTDARECRKNRKESPELFISSDLEKSSSSLLLNFFIFKKRAVLYAYYIITSDKWEQFNSL